MVKKRRKVRAKSGAAKAKPKAARAAKAKGTRQRALPKRDFKARAEILGVLCLKPDFSKAVIVKRFTAEVEAAARKGLIIAVALKTGNTVYGAATLAARKGQLDELIPTAAPTAAKAIPAPVAKVEEEAEAEAEAGYESKEPHANGHDYDHIPQAAASDAQVL